MNKCILLIDDDPDEIDIFSEALSDIDKPAVCIQVTTSNSAMKMLNDFLPDYIFIDMNMPGTDGLKCLEEVKKMKKLDNVPVYLYSTYISKETFDKAMQCGATGCIKKSETVDQLCKILREVFLTND